MQDDNGTFFASSDKLQLSEQTMETSEQLPSALLFLGPGDELWGFDRIWIIIHQGACQTPPPQPQYYHYFLLT
jgi:hypothetical protein